MSVKFPEEVAKQSKDEDYMPPCSEFTSLNLGGTYTYDEGRDVFCLQYNDTGDKVAVGYNDEGVEILDVSTGKPKRSKILKKVQYGGYPVLCLRFHPLDPEMLYIASSSGNMYTCYINGPESWTEQFTEEYQGVKNEINSFDFNHDGSRFCTGGKDLHVRVYDANTCKVVHFLEGYSNKSASQTTNSHAHRIFCVKYLKHQSELRDTFVSGGWDNHIKLWDTRMEDAVRKQIGGPHVCGDSIDILGYKMLVGSWSRNNALKLYDLRAGVDQNNTLPFHVANHQKENHEDTGAYLYCARFYDPDTVVAGGSGTHSVQAVSIGNSLSKTPTREPVIGEMKLCSQSDRVVMALDTHPQGKQLVFGGQGNKLHVASLSKT